MKKSRRILIALLLASSTMFSADAIADTRTLARVDGSQIQYHVDRRGQEKEQSILLLLQGSDCNSIKQHPRIGEYLAVAPDHAVLYIEKYGLTDNLAWSDKDARDDCPRDYLEHNTLEQRVLDVLRVIAQLRHSDKWWNGELLIVGGSAGAMVAGQVAALVPETTQLVIFGFGSRYFRRDLIDSIESSMASSGMPKEKVESELAAVKAQFDSMRDNPSPVLFASGHSYAYWAGMLEFDQLASLSQVTVPVLAVHGARDQSSSPQGARDLVWSLKQNPDVDLDFVEYAELDHSFRDESGSSHTSQVVRDMAHWARRRSSSE
ncbi:MAG: alpha/beta fold hydrolase [Gammaproteobacteria bacterium]